MDKNQKEALQKAIRKHTSAATKSRKAARESLIKEGIYNKRGTLSRNYQQKQLA